MVPLLEGAGHRVEAPDLPGPGDDRTPIAEVSLQGYADRIAELLDAHPEPVVLVGHSAGGGVISQAAEQCPDRIETLVYLAPFATPLAVTEITSAGYRGCTSKPSEGDVRAAALPEGHPMYTSHSPFFSAPEELAEHLESLARA